MLLRHFILLEVTVFHISNFLQKLVSKTSVLVADGGETNHKGD